MDRVDSMSSSTVCHGSPGGESGVYASGNALAGDQGPLADVPMKTWRLGWNSSSPWLRPAAKSPASGIVFLFLMAAEGSLMALLAGSGGGDPTF